MAKWWASMVPKALAKKIKEQRLKQLTKGKGAMKQVSQLREHVAGLAKGESNKKKKAAYKQYLLYLTLQLDEKKFGVLHGAGDKDARWSPDASAIKKDEKVNATAWAKTVKMFAAAELSLKLDNTEELV
ncbi:MAG: hypothetical protein ACI85K_001597 [Hyphomicrobiaceae bacterium]|jgi:hypothetical protein